MRFGFVGPAYASPTPLADAEALVNWRAQKVESPNSRTGLILLPTSGLSLFTNLGNFPTGGEVPSTPSGRTSKFAERHRSEITATAGTSTTAGRVEITTSSMTDSQQ